ncbi:MAG: 5-formyltetrahydrofolate cyclo-ligase [Gammaproteobacteria bacterium]|nr:5-formyltetrahydrofolate cyclo-ligase [Gammaproteobacteria bacterium]
MNKSISDIREEKKQQRQLLDDEYQTFAAMEIAHRLSKFSVINRAIHIATYMPFGGEVNCQHFLNFGKLRKKRIFLPILAKSKLIFLPLKSGGKLLKNHYGILEPVYKKREVIAACDLDIVIVPLVAFDKQCNRLGMGGGFYDRSFAFRKHRQKWRKPLLIGVAYDFQRVSALQPQTWDVPLDAVVTEKECYGSH